MDASSIATTAARTSGTGRDPFRLGARGTRHPGRLDPARSFLRHDVARLRPRHRCLAHPVERPAGQFYSRQIGRARGSDIVQLGKTTTAKRCAGASPRSRPTVSLARRALAATTARPGSCRPISARRASHSARVLQAKEQITMIDHVSIGVRDVARTKRFYDAALKPLGYTASAKARARSAMGADAVALWICAAGARCRPTRNRACISALPRRRAKSVDAFHAAALKSGGRDNGTPGPARRLRSRLLCGLCHRSRRLPDRGPLRARRGLTRMPR